MINTLLKMAQPLITKGLKKSGQSVFMFYDENKGLVLLMGKPVKAASPSDPIAIGVKEFRRVSLADLMNSDISMSDLKNASND